MSEEKTVRESYVVTEEALEAVNTYVPIRIKTELVDRYNAAHVSRGQQQEVQISDGDFRTALSLRQLYAGRRKG